MQTDHVIELIQATVMTALTVGAPLLLVAMFVGCIVSLLQSLTQIQDQALSLIPKMVVTLIVFLICLPWMLDRLVEFTQESYQQIPTVLFRQN